MKTSLEPALAGRPALPPARQTPTIWGLRPPQVHDRFWAARGVQVVRQGEPCEIVASAELFLLTEPRTLALFPMERAVEILNWVKPDLLYLRLRDRRERSYRERAVLAPDNHLLRFERLYGEPGSRLARVVLTPDPRLARLWQGAQSPAQGWRLLRAETRRDRRGILPVTGCIHDRADDAQVMQCLREIATAWPHPASTVRGIRPRPGGAWIHESAQIPPGAVMIGPVWVGAGRQLPPQSAIAGPAILWDDPACSPPAGDIEWRRIEPKLDPGRTVSPRQRRRLSVAAKRLFDIAFALVALLLTLPLYPLIMLAIGWEDGRPFFFTHQRQTRGGRAFGCIKFRSMRRDADRIKAALGQTNQSDGPQFFIRDDPRTTRVGAFLRKSNLDELPQFINVLLGHMSVVGPRPSPASENQFCPAWREARLSVRPGITGLWQVKRTRRQGLDFQEWIKYDIEYVENASWMLDIRIILQTIRLVIEGITRS